MQDTAQAEILTEMKKGFLQGIWRDTDYILTILKKIKKIRSFICGYDNLHDMQVCLENIYNLVSINSGANKPKRSTNSE